MVSRYIITSGDFKNTRARVDFYIPDRLEGYGLNLAALQQLATEKVDLVITVDCGIASHLEISRVRN